MNMNKNWFTRFEQDDVDPQYLANMVEATKYFMSWFPHATHEGFNAMLLKMHEIAARNGYTGYTNSDGPLVAVTNQFRGVNKEAWRPLLKKDWFKGVRNSGEIYPVLRAQRLVGSHHLVNRPKGYELHLPHEDFVPVFLEEMAAAMTKLSKTFCAELLANYVQYFVVGHPFERINFSICMAQANAVLYHYGFETMYHEYFDFDCFVYTYHRTEFKFASRIKRRVT